MVEAVKEKPKGETLRHIVPKRVGEKASEIVATLKEIRGPRIFEIHGKKEEVEKILNKIKNNQLTEDDLKKVRVMGVDPEYRDIKNKLDINESVLGWMQKSKVVKKEVVATK